MVGVASAGVTPPLADDPSLVLRLSFDDYEFYHFGFEQTLYDDNNSEDFNSYGSLSYSTNWKTDGEYSLYGDISGDEAAIYEAFGYRIVVTYDVFVSGKVNNGELRVLVGGSVVKSYTGGKYLNESVTVPAGEDIKFQWYAPTSNDRIQAYIDNIRILKVQADDQSGNGNNGNIYGANWTVGRYGYGLEFDGEDDYVEIPNSESLQENETFTIALWVKITEVKDWGRFAQYGGGGEGWAFSEWSTNQMPIFEWYGTEGGHYYLHDPYKLDLNKWYFLTVVYDYPNNSVKLYANGELIASRDCPEPVVIPTDSLRIGCKGVEFFAGIIDEVRIYNRALSDEEIKAMYEALRVKFYDESTGEKITANATIFNANHSISPQVDSITKEAVLFHADVPQYGLYTIRVAKDGYYTRYYVTELEKEKLVEKSVAILSQNEPSVLLTFKLNDIYNLYDNPILIITKVINNGKYEIFSDTFDVESKASVVLQFNGKYFISVWDPANAVERSFGEITAVESTTKVINVFPNAISDTPLNVTYSIQDAGDKIVVNYNDTEYKTQKIVVRIYNQSGSLVYEDSSTANDYALAFVKPDSSKYYTVVLNITRDNVTFERRQIVGNVTGLLQDVLNLLPGEEVTGYSQDFIMTLISFGGLICLAGLFSKRNSRTGALAFAICAGLVWIFGWLPVSSAVIALIVVMAILGKLEEGYKK
ncbi:LamG domain-containing protein [Archaeoglobus profundus]|uniref:LamG domain-containing protein n=1 Tax=Archaeoglobus profundus TaxID=84156 RepID=UPI001FDF8B7B|nr:LamG domain-containing protein [Archaeoglobus profundus]